MFRWLMILCMSFLILGCGGGDIAKVPFDIKMVNVGHYYSRPIESTTQNGLLLYPTELNISNIITPMTITSVKFRYTGMSDILGMGHVINGSNLIWADGTTGVSTIPGSIEKEVLLKEIRLDITPQKSPTFVSFLKIDPIFQNKTMSFKLEIMEIGYQLSAGIEQFYRPIGAAAIEYSSPLAKINFCMLWDKGNSGDGCGREFPYNPYDSMNLQGASFLQPNADPTKTLGQVFIQPTGLGSIFLEKLTLTLNGSAASEVKDISLLCNDAVNKAGSTAYFGVRAGNQVVFSSGQQPPVPSACGILGDSSTVTPGNDLTISIEPGMLGNEVLTSGAIYSTQYGTRLEKSVTGTSLTSDSQSYWIKK